MEGGEEGGHVAVGGGMDEEGEENGEGVGDGESEVCDGGVHACPSCNDDGGTLVLAADE